MIHVEQIQCDNILYTWKTFPGSVSQFGGYADLSAILECDQKKKISEIPNALNMLYY